mmetsp:Transcript_34776/g.45762  ORF Transcript_34776/g.45762 Transcript_34776/m.45762 type:complete len:161 (+) Transcript_34776:1154-1636(+)
MVYKARTLAKEKDIDAQTILRRNGDTILHVCSEYGQVKLFTFFATQFSAELDIRNRLDETPFTVAAREGRINILKMYFEGYANMFNPDARTLDGWTAFSYACVNGFINTIEYLAERRVNIHTSDRIKRTALHWACRFNNAKVVNTLLKLNLNIEALDRES